MYGQFNWKVKIRYLRISSVVSSVAGGTSFVDLSLNLQYCCIYCVCKCTLNGTRKKIVLTARKINISSLEPMTNVGGMKVRNCVETYSVLIAWASTGIIDRNCLCQVWKGSLFLRTLVC